MKEILERNSEVVREAGRQLVEIGAELAAGKIDDALARLDAARQAYPEWEELDQAAADIDGVIRDREGMLAVQHILAEIIGTVLGSALRSSDWSRKARTPSSGTAPASLRSASDRAERPFSSSPRIARMRCVWLCP